VSFSWLAYSKGLKFPATKPPEADVGHQSGGRFKPFTLPMPHWKLAIHAGYWTVIRTRVVG
jgi:hypothetical protein